MLRNSILILGALVLSPGFCSQAFGDVPKLIDYQGRLTDSGGNPVDTTADLTFTIFADAGGVTSLWTETHPDVVIESGLFTVTLGSYTPFGSTVFNGQQRYLGMQIEGGVMSSPLETIVSTPYALRSIHSDTASYALAAPGGGSSGWTDDGHVVRLNNINDSVGIGTSNPRAPLEVQGPMHGIIGESHGSGTAAGVLGTNDSDGFGLMGVSTSGRGVTGLSISGFGGHFYGPKNYFSGNLGIGTENPEEMLHIYQNSSGGSSFLKIQSDHASNWGEAGLRFETPQNAWHLRMDDDANNNMPSGGLGLRSQNLDDEVMTWSETGHVGIGTNSPNYPLEVVASGTTLRARSTGSGIGVYTSSSSGYGVYSEAPKNFMGGNTGFGTTNPTHRVTVNGEIAIQSGGDTKFHINYYNGGLNISETTVADYRLNIEAGGNVGIGTGSPTAKLHVNGDTRVAGMLTADDFADNTIDRDDIIDEVGIASATSTSFHELTTSWTSYLSKQIAVPTAGYIQATGVAHFILYHGISGYSRGELGISDLPNDMHGGITQDTELQYDVGAGFYEFSIPCRRLFYVSSPGTYTYYMLSRRHSDNDAGIDRLQMDLLFIPTPYGAKNMADGSDAEYANVERTGDPNSGTVATNSAPTGSGNIDQVLAELAALRQTVAELQARLDDK